MYAHDYDIIFNQIFELSPVEKQPKVLMTVEEIDELEEINELRKIVEEVSEKEVQYITTSN